MATVVILEHALQRYVELPYMVYSLAERWRRAGHEVLVHRGLGTPPAGDLAIVNVDLTVIPADYRVLLREQALQVKGRGGPELSIAPPKVAWENLSQTNKQYAAGSFGGPYRVCAH